MGSLYKPMDVAESRERRCDVSPLRPTKREEASRKEETAKIKREGTGKWTISGKVQAKVSRPSDSAITRQSQRQV